MVYKKHILVLLLSVCFVLDIKPMASHSDEKPMTEAEQKFISARFARHNLLCTMLKEQYEAKRDPSWPDLNEIEVYDEEGEYMSANGMVNLSNCFINKTLEATLYAKKKGDDGLEQTRPLEVISWAWFISPFLSIKCTYE